MKILTTIVAVIVAIMATAAPLRLNIDHTTPSVASPQGLWRVPGGALFFITPIPGHEGMYNIVTVDVAQTDIVPGTVMGTVRMATNGTRADAQIFTDMRTGKARKRKADYAITFADNFTTLTFSHYRKGVYVDLVRALPYLFRPGYENRDQRPKALDGAVKLPAYNYPINL